MTAQPIPLRPSALSAVSSPEDNKASFTNALSRVTESLDRVRSVLAQELKSHFDLIEADERTVSRCLNHLDRCLQYTVSGGKMTRGATVPVTYETLVPERTEDQVTLASDIGCCLEILQAAFLVLDDVMDNSILRRGKPCWHLADGVGVSNAVNDGLFLENAVYSVIRRIVPTENRLNILELITETVMRTLLGQNLDVNTHGSVDFYEKRYKAIITSKTSFYSFWLPIAVGIELSGLRIDVRTLHACRAACMVLGEYFQIQDDYLDCYASPDVLGKVGTDIEEGKCTWLAVMAFTLGSEEQKESLRKLFDQKHRSREEVALIKGLYTELNLSSLFETVERQMTIKAEESIAAVEHEGLQKILFMLFARIHKRSK